MSRWHNCYPDGHAFFCTVTVTDWQPVLVEDARLVLYREWEVARRALGVRILAYCVIPNHVHLLLWSERGAAVRDFLVASGHALRWTAGHANEPMETKQQAPMKWKYAINSTVNWCYDCVGNCLDTSYNADQ